MGKADIGMIGLGVMGANLARNMQSKGFHVAVYDRDPERIHALSEEGFTGCLRLEALKEVLVKPRKVFLMVWAGKPVDELIDRLLAILDEGDIIVDGGNSHFPDTIRRMNRVEKAGLLYAGLGVSGGEEGALRGPSLMPGGSPAAWPQLKPILQAICARTEEGECCCDWVGEGGAGHFVKMVHNGIEYGDMQLICEAYQIMRDGLFMNNDEMSRIFEEWNRTELDSYLIEITGKILGCRDEDGKAPVDYILDRAGQKGTGKWTGIYALEEGVPLTLIAEAVFARCLSSAKEERTRAAALFPRNIPEFGGEQKAFTDDLRKALYAAKIVSYAQGYMLMRAAAGRYGWNLNYGSIALMWKGGCIIRSAFLGEIKRAFDRDPDLPNLLLDPWFGEVMKENLPAWRRIVSWTVLNGIPAPALSSGLSWFDGYTTASLPANLLQAQRDYFGAHTYERTDAEPGRLFHTEWEKISPAPETDRN